MAKKITFSLNPQSIDRAIREVEAYQREFSGKIQEVRRRIAERIKWTAEQGFQSAMVSDVIVGPEPSNDVQVSVEHGDKMSVIIADGEQAVFIEFGAGVYHNGPEGSSPHPWGAEKGYLIGRYGKGKGKYDAWSYYDNGKRVFTAGTPAAMPMYHGYMDAVQSIQEIVREVFGND